MKTSLLDILACPLCKGALTLIVNKGDEVEVIEGILNCQNCKEDYSIENSIPDLLPPSLRG